MAMGSLSSVLRHIRIEVRKVDTDPTDAQKESGTYRKGHVSLHGMNIAIENPKGSKRSGKDPDGNEWSVTMPAHYGYVKRTEGADGDHVDVYIGEKPDSGTVYVVNQVDASTKRFDEHKAFIGFASDREVRQTYDAAFDDKRGPARRHSIVMMPVETFKTWLRDGDTRRLLRSAPVKKLGALAELR